MSDELTAEATVAYTLPIREGESAGDGITAGSKRPKNETVGRDQSSGCLGCCLHCVELRCMHSACGRLLCVSELVGVRMMGAHQHLWLQYLIAIYGLSLVSSVE